MGKQSIPKQATGEKVGGQIVEGQYKEAEPALGTKQTPVKVMVSVEVTAYAYAEQDGGYSIIVPALPGCFSEADSIEEITANVREAAEGWLASKESFEIKGGCLP